MKKHSTTCKLFAASSLAMLLQSLAHATNGYYTLGYSAKDKGTAGASIARSSDALSMATNPATMLQVGNRLDIGLNLFMPSREYTISGQPALPDGFSPVVGGIPSCEQPGQAPCQLPFSISQQNIESDREFFFIPNFAYVRQIDSKSAWGVSVYANGGMNTTYNAGSAPVFDPQSNTINQQPGTFGDGRTGVDLTQMFVNVSYAWKPTDKLDLGVGLIGAVQLFRAEGLSAFANISSNPERLTNNGHDTSYGLGLKFGAVYHASDDVSIGASYQTEQKMSKFDDYSGLFAEQGDFDMPASFIVGFSYDLNQNFTFLLDYQEIFYEDVPAVGNSISNLVNGSCIDALNNTLFSGSPAVATGDGCLGGDNGAGFGWENMEVIKLGLEYRNGGDVYRFGISTTDQPVPSEEVNFAILAPGVIEKHISVGYTTLINEREWTFFGMYMPNKKISGTSLFDPGQMITTEMSQFEFGFAVSF